MNTNQLLNLYNLLNSYFCMLTQFLQKKVEITLENRKQARSKLFLRNRLYLKQRSQFLLTQMIAGEENYSQIHCQQHTIHQEYQVIIDTYNVTHYSFPCSSFQLEQLPQLMAILNSTHLIQQYKSVLGIDFLAHIFNNNQQRHNILLQNVVEKLINYLNTDNSLLILKSISILRKLACSIKEQEQFHLYMNCKKIDFQAVLRILYSKHIKIRVQALIFIKQLLQSNFKFQKLSHKQKLYQVLKCLTQSQFNPISRVQQELILDIIQKEGISFKEKQFNNIQLACRIQLRIAEKHKDTKRQHYYFARISKMMIQDLFAREFNKAITQFTFKQFQLKYPYFNSLIRLIIFKERVINDQKIIFLQEYPLKKLMSYKNIFSYLVYLNLLQKLRESFLSQSLAKHSQDWSVAISCLILIEKLFRKKYISYIESLAQDSVIFQKMQELYTVHHQYLRKQLNNTLNSIIRLNSSCLLYKLGEHNFIRHYLSSLELYSKNTVKVAISQLKKSILHLQKSIAPFQDNKTCSFIKKQILQVQHYFSTEVLKNIFRQQLIQPFFSDFQELIM